MPAQEVAALFTVGHSNHALEKFIKLLRQHEIRVIGDVRSSPYSRLCPHFNQVQLKSALAETGIDYVFLGKELGARPTDRNCFVNGRVSYERLAERREFHAGLDWIRLHVSQRRLALLCAEKDPLDCHRMILVSRHLRSTDLSVQHILPDGLLESNDNAERRLCQRLNLQPNLFFGEAEVIEQAYAQQAERIAFAQTQEYEPAIE